MSAAEFTQAFKNKAIKAWLAEERGEGIASQAVKDKNALENINNLVRPTTFYRTSEQSSDKTSFLITKSTIQDLLVEFKGLVPGSPELAEATALMYKKFKQKNSGAIVSRRELRGVPGVYFPNIGFDTITTMVNNILELDSGVLSTKYQKGHVVGLNTQLLEVTRNRLATVDTTGSTGKKFLLDQLDKIIDYYKRLDYASANQQPADKFSVYASVNKEIKKSGKTRYIVELQLESTNQRSADEVKATIGNIRKLFTGEFTSEKQAQKLLDSLAKKVTDGTLSKELLEVRSSPSFKEMIINHLIGTIQGKTVDQSVVHNKLLIATKKSPKVNLSEISKNSKELIANATKLANKLRTAKPQQTSKVNLSSLLVYINNHLQSVISANMGSGTETKVLNYRSGRFAGSAKVERLSESRAGMITAFYSYMKNPYQTFEPGFAQGSPASRNPRNLIGTSIREIAATKVANQLRAVSV